VLGNAKISIFGETTLKYGIFSKTLNVCVAIIKKLERHVDILPVVCSVADYEFI
jgi:hypothetical protein